MIIKDSDRETHLERWLEIRRNGLTATEVGQIASGKASVAEIVERKQRGYTVPSNPFMEWGNIMEPHILAWLRMKMDNIPVDANSHIVEWDEDPFCLSTPDGFMEGAVVECKTTGHHWEPLQDDSLPMVERFKACKILHYFYQCQWQMLTCDLDECVFAWNVRELAPLVEYRLVDDGERRVRKFFIGGEEVDDPKRLFTPGEFYYITIERDAEVCERLFDIMLEVKNFDESLPPIIPVKAITFMRMAKRYEARAKELRAEAMEIVSPLIKPGEKVSGGWGSVSCSERKTTRVDTNKLKFEHPDLFSKYSSESTSTQIRFTLKEED